MSSAKSHQKNVHLVGLKQIKPSLDRTLNLKLDLNRFRKHPPNNRETTLN